jgi:hypothetical protein
MNVLAPEEIELNKKRRVLERLKGHARRPRRGDDRPARRARNFVLNAIRGAVHDGSRTRRFYAELDEIEAQIAEEEVKLVPDDEEIKKRAEELRRRAEESAVNIEDGDGCTQKWRPTAEAKKAYHNLAKIIHPDLALDAEEKEKRHSLMAKLNEAYSAGDQNRLNKLVEDFRDSPDLVRGDSVGDELVRAIRQIWQIRNRLKELKEEKAVAELSELFVLREKVEAEMREGRNMLKQMAERTKTYIKKSERRLANLRNLNEAQEEYVKERFGMDISAFR